MRHKTIPVAKVFGASAAKALDDRKLAKVFYRRPPSAGQNYGPVGLMLDANSAVGADYAKRPCVCDAPLGYGPLSLWSDGTAPVRLVHQACARRAVEWARVNDYTDLRPAPAPVDDAPADPAKEAA